jgi:hypothetical protein
MGDMITNATSKNTGVDTTSPAAVKASGVRWGGNVFRMALIQEIGQEIFDLIVRVCNREMVKAERLGYGGFAITRAAWSG